MKKLCEFIDTDKDIEVKGITDDSRLVKDGYIFVATEGYFVDHFKYVYDAVKNGACLVVTDREIELDVPCLVVADVNSYYIELCKKFYDISLEDFRFVGVTGTDGKTTVTTVIQRLFNNYEKWALIGTNGVYVDDDFYETHNTTPCISELFQALRFIKDKKCQNIVMEVSSEALLHKRLESFLFDAVIFTNITEDHLNIHKTIDNYRKCKFKLLDMVKDKGIVIINGDDENCKMIYKDNM